MAGSGNVGSRTHTDFFGAYGAFPSDQQARAEQARADAAMKAAAMPENRGRESLLRTKSEEDLLNEAFAEKAHSERRAKGLLASYAAKLMRDGRSSYKAAEDANTDARGVIEIRRNAVAKRFYERS